MVIKIEKYISKNLYSICMESCNEKTEEELKKTFKILGNPNRLKIIELLAQDKKEATVSEITQKIGLTQPAASQHLKILKKSEILICDKRGNNIYYKINIKTMQNKKECIDSLFFTILNKSN